MIGKVTTKLVKIQQINNLGETVILEYTDHTYTLSVSNNGRVLKACSNNYELVRSGFEFFIHRGDGHEREGQPRGNGIKEEAPRPT